MAKKKSAAPTKSFDELVSDTQIRKLQPMIQQMVGAAFQQATQAIYKFVLTERAALQTRQMAFERLLVANEPWFNMELLALEIAAVEDEAQGLVVSDAPAKVGDKVRVEACVKSEGAAEYGESSKFAIHQVGVKSPEGTYQTNEDLENAILGLRAGESREFDMSYFTGEGESKATDRAKVTVMRVSSAGPAPEGSPQ